MLSSFHLINLFVHRVLGRGSWIHPILFKWPFYINAYFLNSSEMNNKCSIHVYKISNGKSLSKYCLA